MMRETHGAVAVVAAFPAALALLAHGFAVNYPK